MATLTDRTLNGILWLFTGAVAQAVLQLVVLAVLARLLVPAEFGVIGGAMVVIGFAQIFSQLGIGPAVVQTRELSESRIATAFTLSVVSSVAIGVFVALCAPAYARLIDIPGLEEVVRALAWLFPLTGLRVVAESLLQRDLAFRRLAAIQFASYALGYGGVGIVLAHLGYGVWSLVLAQLAQTALSTALLSAQRSGTIRFGFEWGDARRIMHYGAGFSSARIANHLALHADNFVVGRWLGAEALGLYGRAYQFLLMPVNLLGQVTDKALFPALASVQDDRAKLGRAYTQAVSTIALVALPVGAVLSILAPEIVAVVLGAGWDAVVGPFRVFALVLVFRTSYKLSASVVKATGAVYQNAWRQVVYLTLVSAGAVIGQSWGVTGVAVGVSAAVVVHFCLMLQIGLNQTGADPGTLLRSHLRHACIAALIAAATYAAAEVGRGADFPAIGTLSLAAAAAGAVFGGLWWGARRAFGTEGDWIRTLIRRRLGERAQ